ncbi:MAG: hypothetical protein JSR33_03150 [Proteobacteria bacterium]|nr:hypothetical protein [Pseudomonadota bacterium]
MNFEFFPPDKDRRDSEMTLSQLSKDRKATSLERKTESREILGKHYSFEGTDKPVLCTLRAEPLKKKNNIHFTLSYVESSDSLQAISLYVEIEKSGLVFLALSAIKDTKAADFFEKINKKAQEINVLPEIHSTDTTYLYNYKGSSEKIKKLFPLLENHLMADRYCSYGKEYLLTPLFTLFTNLYTTIEQNFSNQAAKAPIHLPPGY